MASIHHATIKKATALGMTIEAIDHDYFVVTDDESKDTLSDASGLSAKQALEEAVAYRNRHEAGELGNDDDYEEDDNDDGEDEQEVRSGSVVKDTYKRIYKARGDETTCGDGFSGIFKEATTGVNEKGKPCVDEELLERVAAEVGLTSRLNGWGHLNPGMRSMNLRNSIRKLVRDGDTVTIDGTTIEENDLIA